MLTEKNFADALKIMNFTANGNHYEKVFSEGVVMRADLSAKKLFYPAQLKGRDRNNFFDESHKENLVVFECVNRLLDKGYKPEDIELERRWQLGHSPKGGRADICVSSNGSTLFIIECKTFGAEFNQEIKNMLADGGQLFSYWQQEQSCQWLILYAANFDDGNLTFKTASVPCGKKFYSDATTVEERFEIWRDRYEKNFLGDVIFHDETVAYQIGAKPLRKRDLKDFDDTSLVNKFEEILRHNQVSDKENAFNRLVALFICKLADESRALDNDEVSFQFKVGSDTHETFQDKLQKLYADGMKKFMGEDIFYLPEDYPDRLFENFIDEENHDNQIRDLRENFRKLKFYTNNAFAFVDVNNDKLFYLNAKILKEVVDTLRGYRIIGSKDLQTLGDMFEQLLDKGFKQDAGQFFTPTPIAQFIWDSLPLDRLIVDTPPKIIDYACGAGHFLTEGFKAINDFYAQRNLTPPYLWERDRLFGVEKDYRLARVSKISLFMHGANEGKIKFGDGLEDYPDEKISPATFDVLVANPPYSVKGFKQHLKLANEENFSVLDKISNQGSEIETLFAERIGQLVKAQGVAAVILPSSILNKDGKSFVAARESLLKKFFIKAIVQLGSKTFSATGTNTVIMFLERFDEPPLFTADFEDVAESIITGKTLGRKFSRDIFDAYLKKIGKSEDDYRNFIAAANDKILDLEREKIFYFGLTFRQTTLVISATVDKDEETFLGYGWTNAKGREGIVHKKRGGLLFDNANRAADNTLAAVVRAAYRGEQIQMPKLEKYFHYSTLADLIDFNTDNFTKKITVTSSDYKPDEYSGNFSTVKLGDVAPFVNERTTLDEIQIADFVTTDNMLKDKRGIKTYDGVPQISGLIKFSVGDVLVSNIRPYLKKIWLADRNGGCSPDVLVFRSRDKNILLPEYLMETLKLDDFFAFAMSTAKGMKMPRGDKNKIQSYKLPLPPVDIQHQIVDEFRAIDDEIAAQVETIKNLDADIQKKFTALFDGLNDNIPLENIFQSIETGSRPKGGVSEFTEGILSLGGEHIDNTTGYLNLENKKFVPKDFFDTATSGKIGRNDILICKDGALSGKVALVRDELEDVEALANEHVFVLRNSSKTLQLCLFHYLFFKDGQQQLKSKITGMAQGGINRTNLLRIKIPLPPIELQEEFAAYVTNCESMKKSARTRREELIRKRGELVTKYFK